MYMQLSSVQSETQAALKQSAQALSVHDQRFMEVRGRVQKLELSLTTKKEELGRQKSECDKKRAELVFLIGAQASLQSVETDFKTAKQASDDFEKSYAGKAAELKKSVKDATDEIREVTEAINSDSSLLQELSACRQEVRGTYSYLSIIMPI